MPSCKITLYTPLNFIVNIDAPWRWLWTILETCRSAFTFRN